MNRDELLDFLADLDDLKDDDARFTAFFRAIDSVYREEIAKLNNEDFEIDPEGMGHFTDFTSFMAKVAKEGNGRVEFDIHEPRENMAGITTYIRVFWLVGDQLREFCKLLVWASSWSIDALVDGTVCISVRFVGVYRKKQGKHN